MNRIDDRIAREICGWVKTYPSTMDFAGAHFLWAINKNSYREKFFPSTNIAHAIEALECLPNDFEWRITRTPLYRFVCEIHIPKHLPLRLFFHRSGGEHLPTVICHALLSKEVIVAVKAARKAVRK